MATREVSAELAEGLIITDPESLPRVFASDNRGIPRVFPYDGKNVLPTQEGYKSFFGLGASIGNTSPAFRHIQEIVTYRTVGGNLIVLGFAEDGLYMKSLEGDAALSMVEVTADITITLNQGKNLEWSKIISNSNAGISPWDLWTYAILKNKLYLYQRGMDYIYYLHGDAHGTIVLDKLDPLFIISTTGKVYNYVFTVNRTLTDSAYTTVNIFGAAYVSYLAGQFLRGDEYIADLGQKLISDIRVQSGYGGSVVAGSETVNITQAIATLATTYSTKATHDSATSSDLVISDFVTDQDIAFLMNSNYDHTLLYDRVILSLTLNVSCTYDITYGGTTYSISLVGTNSDTNLTTLLTFLETIPNSVYGLSREYTSTVTDVYMYLPYIGGVTGITSTVATGSLTDNTAVTGMILPANPVWDADLYYSESITTGKSAGYTYNLVFDDLSLSYTTIGTNESDWKVVAGLLADQVSNPSANWLLQDADYYGSYRIEIVKKHRDVILPAAPTISTYGDFRLDAEFANPVSTVPGTKSLQPTGDDWGYQALAPTSTPGAVTYAKYNITVDLANSETIDIIQNGTTYSIDTSALDTYVPMAEVESRICAISGVILATVYLDYGTAQITNFDIYLPYIAGVDTSSITVTDQGTLVATSITPTADATVPSNPVVNYSIDLDIAFTTGGNYTVIMFGFYAYNSWSGAYTNDAGKSGYAVAYADDFNRTGAPGPGTPDVEDYRPWIATANVGTVGMVNITRDSTMLTRALRGNEPLALSISANMGTIIYCNPTLEDAVINSTATVTGYKTKSLQTLSLASSNTSLTPGMSTTQMLAQLEALYQVYDTGASITVTTPSEATYQGDISLAIYSPLGTDPLVTVTNSGTEVNVAGATSNALVKLANVEGICTGRGRLIAWDYLNAIYIGSNQNVIDFTPSIQTQANVVTVDSIKGKIIKCVPTEDGFLVYATGNIIRATYVGGQYVYKYKPVSSFGVVDPRHITQSGNLGFHYSANGIIALDMAGAQDKFAAKELTAWIEKFNLPIHLSYVSDRYLLISLDTEPKRVSMHRSRDNQTDIQYLGTGVETGLNTGVAAFQPASWNLSAYPEFSMAFVYDTYTGKWGQAELDFKSIFSMNPINQMGYKVENLYEAHNNAYGSDYAGLAVYGIDDTVKILTDEPTDSYLVLGKFQLSKSGTTCLTKASLGFKGYVNCTVTAELSIDGRVIEWAYDVDSPTITAPSYDFYLTSVAKWFNIVIKGKFNLTYVELEGYKHANR